MAENEEMQDGDIQAAAPMRLRYACLFYAAGCLLMYLAYVLGLGGGMMVLLYLVIGVALNRLVLRRLVEWHPMHNTLGEVANAKLSSVLFWPLSYLFLFCSLAIDKLL
ncbi:MAG: hypothetical protein ACFNLD_03380 [Kingella oralis]|jgi:hypothetical protein|uniref:hypothetical protein n=1 Tax=Kingella oralis TaxID=505 RepID=UPI00360C9975